MLENQVRILALMIYAKISPDIGEHVETKLFACFINKVKEARANGLSSHYETKLLNFLKSERMFFE